MIERGETCPTLESIEAAAAGMPGGEDVLRHAQTCGHCGALLAEASSNIALLDSIKTVVRPGGRSVGLPMSGDNLAGYEIQDVIHKGGQGVVYKAFHAATKREVALKVLLGGGFATKDQIARFHREAELVAHLDHPGIVTVFDSGVDESGQAYLVMELVEGRDLATWIREERETRSVREIIDVFIGICDAVRHAHQRGVIHRDLKPGNIMVNLDGQPRVLDFGIAKVVRGDDGADAEAGGVTREGEFVGTFLYASPEQVTDGSAMVDVRTDVYAIGMMLYEALAGRRPYELKGGIAEVVEIIKEAPIAAPGDFDSRVDHEVDTITLKALTKDPLRRYQSVGALAEDLRRYLRDDPIEAKRDSRTYVFRKLAWKHRVAIGVASAFVIVMMGSTIGMTVLAIKAMKASDRAQRESARAQEESRQERAARQAMSEVLNGVVMDVTEKKRFAIEDWLDVAENRFRSAPDLAGGTRAEMLSSLGVGNLDRGRYDEALGLFEHVLSMHNDGGLDDPVAHANSLFNLGRVHWRRAEYEIAESYYVRALEMRRELHGDDHPDVATALHHLGSTLTQLGQFAEAESLLDRAYEIRRSMLDANDPEIDNTLNSLLVCLRAQSKYKVAITRAEELLSRLIEHSGEDDWRVGRTRHNLGLNLADTGQYSRAEREFNLALENKLEWRGEDHLDTARTYAQLARVQLDRWEWEGHEVDTNQILAWCEQAMRVQREVLDAIHPELVTSRVQFIRALLASGDATSALEQSQDLLAQQLAAYTGEARWQVAQSRCLIGICLSAQGKHAQAVRIAVEGERGVRGAPGAKDRVRWAALRRAAAVSLAAGDTASAERYLSDAGKVFGVRAE